MARYSIDCRKHPSANNCTIQISADKKEEVLDAAVQHACTVHGHKDSPELRQQIGGMIQQS